MHENTSAASKFRTGEKYVFAAFLILLVITTFNREFLVFGRDARILPLIVGALSVCVVFWNYFHERRPDYRLRFRGVNRWLIAYFCLALLVNFKWYNSPHVLVLDIFKVVFIANALNLFFLVVVGINRRNLSWELVSTAILVGGFVLFGSMLYVFLGGDLSTVFSEYRGMETDGISRSLFNEFRYGGYAQDPNFASLFMAIWGGVAFYEWRRTRRSFYLLIPVFALFGYAMALSKSLLVLFLLALILGIFSRSMIGAFIKEVVVLGAFTGPLLVVSLGSYFPQLQTLRTRYLMWENALALVPDNPILGNGLTAARSANLSLNWYSQNHNTVTQTVTELGLLGLLLLYLAVRRAIMSAHPLMSYTGILFLGTFLTYETMSHSLSVLVLAILPLALRQRKDPRQKTLAIYVINGLSYGGAERVVRNMVGSSKKEDQINIYTFGEKDPAVENLPSNVAVSFLAKKRSYTEIPFLLWKLSFYLERDWSRYNVDLATSHLPFAQLLTRLTAFDTSFIYVIHGMYGISHEGFPALCTRWLYNSRKIVAVSHQMLDIEMKENFRVRSKQMGTIWNLLDFSAIDKQLEPFENEAKTKTIVNLGRYYPEKNQIATVAAFDESGLKNDGYKLAFFGEGPSRGEIQAEIDRRQLGDCVTVNEYCDNPFREMRKAAAVIHTAEYESYGMVIVEAHYCRVPVVAFDVPYGISEIMPGRLQQYLVKFGDCQALGSALREAILEPYPYDEAKKVIDCVCPEVVMSKYYELYEKWSAFSSMAKSRDAK